MKDIIVKPRDWDVKTWEITPEIFVTIRNTDNLASTLRLTTVPSPHIWYAVERSDGTLLGTYTLDMEYREIELFTSFTREASVVLLYRDAQDISRNQTFYLHKEMGYDQPVARFRDTYQSYDQTDPCRLDYLCFAAEMVIEEQTNRFYPTQEEEQSRMYGNGDPRQLLMGQAASAVAHGGVSPPTSYQYFISAGSGGSGASGQINLSTPKSNSVPQPGQAYPITPKADIDLSMIPDYYVFNTLSRVSPLHKIGQERQ